MPDPSSESMSGTAVLLINLGTPSAPTASAVRRYLGQFLGDRRVALGDQPFLPLQTLDLPDAQPDEDQHPRDGEQGRHQFRAESGQHGASRSPASTAFSPAAG